MLKKGTQVKLIQPVIMGSVMEAKVDGDGETLIYLIEWYDDQGEMHTRYFPADMLEQVEG